MKLSSKKTGRNNRPNDDALAVKVTPEAIIALKEVNLSARPVQMANPILGIAKARMFLTRRS
jgi:hypothetical protein